MVRRTYPPRSTKCARCSGTRAKGQVYCRPCTNAYRRAYRQGEKLLAPPTLQPRPMTDAEIDECARRGLAQLRGTRMTWRDELKTLTDAGIEPRYPWREWFDGSARELVQGCDYMTDSKTFYNVAFKAAARRGLRLRGKATEAACTIVAFSREHVVDKVA